MKNSKLFLFSIAALLFMCPMLGGTGNHQPSADTPALMCIFPEVYDS